MDARYVKAQVTRELCVSYVRRIDARHDTGRRRSLLDRWSELMMRTPCTVYGVAYFLCEKYRWE